LPTGDFAFLDSYRKIDAIRRLVEIGLKAKGSPKMTAQ
jgi:hypothetical protein